MSAESPAPVQQPNPEHEGLYQLAEALQRAEYAQVPTVDAPDRTRGDHWGARDRRRHEITDPTTGTGVVVEAERFAAGVGGANTWWREDQIKDRSALHPNAPAKVILTGHENTQFRFVETTDELASGQQIKARVNGSVDGYTPTFGKVNRDFVSSAEAGKLTRGTHNKSASIDPDNMQVGITHIHQDGTTTVNKLTGNNALRAQEIITKRAASALGNVASAGAGASRLKNAA